MVLVVRARENEYNTTIGVVFFSFSLIFFGGTVR